MGQLSSFVETEHQNDVVRALHSSQFVSPHFYDISFPPVYSPHYRTNGSPGMEAG
ncbi:hypothetical protein Barb4_04286 [Bacteroidales bacterium Barb4]|nr:hypothetical protein Barb4_04286 [Bacteroidales bacterium Barb4]